MNYPLIIDIDDRHKVTLESTGTSLYFKTEFLMDSQVWVVTENYLLSKAKAGSLGYALLDKANELDGPKLRKPRR